MMEAHPAAEGPPMSTFKRKGLSTTELQNCQRAFKAMDKEHSGTISLTELAKVRCRTVLEPPFLFARAAINPHPAAEHGPVGLTRRWWGCVVVGGQVMKEMGQSCSDEVSTEPSGHRAAGCVVVCCPSLVCVGVTPS